MLKQRIITALILAPIAIGGVFLLPPDYFALFIGFVLTVSAWEWANLADWDGAARFVYAIAMAAGMAAAFFVPPMPLLVVGALWWLAAFVLVIQYPRGTQVWSHRLVRSVLGVVVIIPGFVSLNVLKQFTDASFLILLLFMLVWSADVGAYFSGRAFGKAKLAPAVSPGKSWAGLYGGLVTAVLVVAGMVFVYGRPVLVSSAGLVLLVACSVIVLISVLGDLTLSMFKRQRGIKDSSQLLPGHGGFLDRIDSLLSAGPCFALYLLLAGWATL